MDENFYYLHATKQQLVDELQRNQVAFEPTFTLSQLKRLYIQHLVGQEGDHLNEAAMGNVNELPDGNAGIEEQAIANEPAIENEPVIANDVPRPLHELEEEVRRMEIEQRGREVEMRQRQTEYDARRLRRDEERLQRNEVVAADGAQGDELQRQFRRQTFDDIKHMAPFTGDNAYGVKKFFEDYEKVVAPLHWEEHYKYLSLRRLIDGTVGRFLRTTTVTNYIEAKEALLGEFDQKLPYSIAYAQRT